MTVPTWSSLSYLFCAVLFILGLKLLGHVRTARRGNSLAAVAMLLAVVTTLIEMGHASLTVLLGSLALGSIIGGLAAYRVQMTSMPEMVALFNGLGGAASALVAACLVLAGEVDDGMSRATSAISIVVGTLTLTGSLTAYGKLKGSLFKGRAVLWPGRHVINLVLLSVTVGVAVLFGIGSDVVDPMDAAFVYLPLLSAALGVTLVLPIGGADMPVVVSLLNSYSGLAASAAGFATGHLLMIIGGALVGAAGLILTKIMCDAMNRSLLNVLAGGFGQSSSSGSGDGGEYTGVRSCDAETAAMLLEDAQSVVVVPGYGLAVAQAQHVVKELMQVLEEQKSSVRFAIHPVAGRMPGHMNVLMAEADIPYDKLAEMDAINPDLAQTDVAVVVGANDVVNPAAVERADSPIYGMPILNVHQAKSVFVIKRSLGSGYAGIKNELFERDNTMMIFGDAKAVLQDLVKALRH